jgi:hypothetical protein
MRGRISIPVLPRSASRPGIEGKTNEETRDVQTETLTIKATPEVSNLDLFSLEMFENIAYVMAKHADGSIPDTPEDWLDAF